MIYTIRPIEPYWAFSRKIKNIAIGKKPPSDEYPHGYSGAMVFKSVEDAQRYLDEIEDEAISYTRAIFSVSGDWDIDTEPDYQEWYKPLEPLDYYWRNLINDCELLKPVNNPLPKTNNYTQQFAQSIISSHHREDCSGEYCTFCHSSRLESGVIVHHDNCVVITAHNWLTSNTEPYPTITVDLEVGQDILKIIRDYTGQYDD